MTESENDPSKYYVSSTHVRCSVCGIINKFEIIFNISTCILDDDKCIFCYSELVFEIRHEQDETGFDYDRFYYISPPLTNIILAQPQEQADGN